MNPPVPHRAKGNLLLLFYANDGYCCSCYNTHLLCFNRGSPATTVKATFPIFQIDFYFYSKSNLQVYSRLPHTRRGNQLSLVNETNNDSIIFIYTKLFTESALHTARDVVSLLWFQSHFFGVQNYVSVRSQTR